MVSGHIPEFGAIFMSSVETKKECLERKIFALPPSQAEFVEHIKSGMFLFLFEHEKRQLFGVYQASSDGAMDIVPHAFKYSGRHYPAQVCIKLLQEFEPLSEKVFRDAIRENYFSAKKFKFGLSEDQVRRLVYLFSSRKLLNRISRHPLSEASVEVNWRDRIMLVGARLGLSERGYIEPYENNEFRPAASCDHHPNSLTRATEYEHMEDDGVSTEGKMKYHSEEDFLAKRRRLGNADKFIKRDVAEKGICNNHTGSGIVLDESPTDALDEVRRSASVRRLSPVERVNKTQQHYILDRSGYPVETLDVRTNDDFTFRMLDDYKMQNGYGQVFASDRREESLDKIKCHVQRYYDTHDTADHLANGNNNLNLCRRSREWTDQECLMTRNLVYRRHSKGHRSPVHNIRNGSAAGELQFNESEPDLDTRPSEHFPSGNTSPLLQCSHRNMHNMDYPIVEQRLNENTAEKNFRLTNSAMSSGHPSPITSTEYSSFSHKQNLSSLPDKSFPEEGVAQSHSAYVNATITRVVPYSPEHPDLPHGFFSPRIANPSLSLKRENNSRHYSLGDFYSRFKETLPQDLLEPGKLSNRSINIAPECTLHESNRSFLNPNLPVHLDPSTSIPIDYDGSQNLSPPHTDLENIGGGNVLLSTASHVNQHVLLHEMEILVNKDLSFSKAKYFSLCDSQFGRNWANNENQYVRYSSNMNNEKPNPTVNRRSVFSRLTCKEESKFDEGTSDMHATADEVLESLQKSNTLAQKSFRESRIGGSTKGGENAVHAKKFQHIETNHSTVEVNRGNNASTTAADGIDDLPIETRVVGFKRRSERERISGITADMNPTNKITCADEVKEPVNSTVKRRKLVRPDFSNKTVSATDAICSKIPAPNLDEVDKRSHEAITNCGKAKIPMPNNSSHPTECNNNEHQIPEEKKDVVAHKFAPTSLEIKGHDSTNLQPMISEVQNSDEVINTAIPDPNLSGSYTEVSNVAVGCENNHLKA